VSRHTPAQIIQQVDAGDEAEEFLTVHHDGACSADDAFGRPRRPPLEERTPVAEMADRSRSFTSFEERKTSATSGCRTTTVVSTSFAAKRFGLDWA
jgi:hypothetical protein